MNEMNEQKRETMEDLIQTAISARKRAYVPYSNYPVGAALLTKSGKVYTGVNIENASYPLTICAERTAIFKAVSEGEFAFDTIVIATKNGGSPCGACRQVMSEFAPEMKVITTDESGQVIMNATVAEILPGAFDKKKLA